MNAPRGLWATREHGYVPVFEAIIILVDRMTAGVHVNSIEKSEK